MLYPTSKQLRDKRHHLLPLAALALAVVLFVFKVPMPSFLSDAAQYVGAPVWGAQERMTGFVRDTKTLFADKHLLAEQNTALTEELATMRRENFLVRMYMEENAQLRELLGRAEEAGGKIPTSIIHSEVWAPYDTLIVDAGSRLGVREGMLVVSAEGVALGSVVRARSSRSVVALLSAPGKETNVVIHGTSTTHARMVGMGAATMRLSIPREIEVATGDPVVLGAFPSYLVGHVADIIVRPEDAQQRVYVRSPSNTHTMRFVLIDALHAWEPPQDITPDEGLTE